MKEETAAPADEARGFAAVVFDFDGVLIDSADAYLSVFSEAVAPVTRKDWPKLYGMTTPEAVAYAAGGALPQARVDQLSREIDRKVGRVLSRTPPPRRGAEDFLRAVRAAGLKTAVASAASHFALDGTIAALGWSPLFDAVVGREDVERAKPFPDVYSEAVRRLGVTGRQAAAIEDTDIGVRSARDAGLYVIALGGTQRRGELASADCYYPDFPALMGSHWLADATTGAPS